VEKYALACARTRPTDTVMMQKTFFEAFKQQQGEYLGSVLSGWLESMLPLVKSDGELELGDETFGKGLNNAVKDNDNLYPPEWRLSYGARSPKPSAAADLDQLRRQVEALQREVRELQGQIAKGGKPS
jgi:hypothetical protein